ncbi:MAG: patatin-like phospholipase family protein [Myxococcota bacterium]
MLSGGGARGAYEAGVLTGLIEVLQLDASDRCPFQIFSGTSVGAINAIWAAANAHRGDMDADGLREQWRRLSLDTHLRLDLPGLFGVRARWAALAERLGKDVDLGERWGRSIVDGRPLERIVSGGIPWDRLHDNVRRGVVSAAVVAALQIRSGRTAMFAELAPGTRFRASRDPRRTAVRGEIGAEHVLASAAIPFLFPARRVAGDYYCDGGLRFTTPIAPALRCGAERLVVVSLLGGATARTGPEVERRRIEAYPHLRFLAGKLINSLLLDSVDYDLHVLDRFNKLLAILEERLEPDELRRVQRTMEETRGAGYRFVETLCFRPSEDLGQAAAELTRRVRRRSVGAWAVTRMLQSGAFEDDLLSFMLFDGEFADHLMELGRRDVKARADEVRTFFEPPR